MSTLDEEEHAGESGIVPLGEADSSPDLEALRAQGLAIVRAGADLDVAMSDLLETRLDNDAAIDSYLYVIVDEDRKTKPIVGPTIDFKREIVRQLNAMKDPRTKQPLVKLVIAERPIIEDITIPQAGGGSLRLVRAMVCVRDELTGDVWWGVKEEPRRSRHSATIAVEKAAGKAFESHPSYNRKRVNQIIRAALRRSGLDPGRFIIGSGGGAFGDFFARAEAAGVKRGVLRERVRTQTGRGMSEAKTSEEIREAAKVVDTATGAVAETEAGARGPAGAPEVPPAPPPGPPETPPPPAAPPAEVTPTGKKRVRVSAAPAGLDEEGTELRRKSIALIESMGAGGEFTAELFLKVKSDPAPTAAPVTVDYRRFYHALSLISVGMGFADAVADALHRWPK